MDIQTKINNLKYWFFQTLENEGRPYFMLAKPHGNGRQQITNQEGGDVNALWENLERNIFNEYNNGVRRFLITVRKGGMKGSPFESELDLGWSVQNAGGAAINGTPGAQPAQVGGIYGPDAIAAIKNELRQDLEEKYKEREERLKKDFEHEKQISNLRDEIAAISQSQQTGWDRFMSIFEMATDKIEALGGFDGLSKLVLVGKADPNTAKQMVMAGIAGIKSSSSAQRRHIKEQPAPEGATVPPQPDDNGTEEETDEMEVDEATQVQYDLACDGVDLMAAAGIENPGEKLLKVARFAASDPAQAKTFLKMMPDV